MDKITEKTYQTHGPVCDYIFHSAIYPENISKNNMLA
jgi:hypothetical protein